MIKTETPREKLLRLMAESRAKKAVVTEANDLTPITINLPSPAPVITYNAEQQAFVDLVTSGRSCVLIGAAGTGKTTCTKGAIQSLIQTGQAGVLQTSDHKHLKANTPGIVCISYTRRAVNNIRKAMDSSMKNNCMTIHKLLEYQPVYNTVIDQETGESRESVSFEATRNFNSPLPAEIHTIVIDESSMVSTDYFEKIEAALHPSTRKKVQFIFLGDIQQLPPVFGSAILGFKMLTLPVIELTQVYRQALESPIIRLAHRILSGVEIAEEQFNEWAIKDKLKIMAFPKKFEPAIALIAISKFITTYYEAGVYDPEQDQILIPFNKGLGTLAVNNYVANFIAKRVQRPVYHVIAGYTNLYFSIGDKILVDKEDAIILDIRANPKYLGKVPKKQSITMDYEGNDTMYHSQDEFDSLANVDHLLNAFDKSSDEATRQCSHILKVRLLDTDREQEIYSVGDIKNIILAYALTVHKSQGSEWRKVFCFFHNSHNTMIQRELLYTAVTRARECLYVICEKDTFSRGITGQRITGNTLVEKAEFFKGKVEAGY